MIDPDDPATTLLTTEQAAIAAHVDAGVIRQWAARGLITAATDGPRYLETDILRTEFATRRATRERQLATEAISTLTQPP